MKIKPRNAGAVAAWFKTGSGLHKRKNRSARVKSVAFNQCDDCGCVLDEGDDSQYCIDCEDFWVWKGGGR